MRHLLCIIGGDRGDAIRVATQRQFSKLFLKKVVSFFFPPIAPYDDDDDDNDDDDDADDDDVDDDDDDGGGGDDRLAFHCLKHVTSPFSNTSPDPGSVGR